MRLPKLDLAGHTTLSATANTCHILHFAEPKLEYLCAGRTLRLMPPPPAGMLWSLILSVARTLALQAVHTQGSAFQFIRIGLDH